MARADKEEGDLRSTAELTDVPYSTLTDISARLITGRGDSGIQVLPYYFTSLSEESVLAESADGAQ
ncbi:hypothetical protein BGLT_06781 [Caballeronia glathei]|uniref:Uncharacterized protein n=1 Tax=Caballeronia glathei TaxID=60547 RepID=A0A069PMR9_9BURK|nr:hypothetical protein [Caballeronia glathei]KDR41174.1 hypothetical protein BG61_20785 [Caballeronia glathei]CDY77975.1 hypothetical protein BGLT_06781 [Caballeronia glathei]